MAARVEDLCGFSGHADVDEILRWLRQAGAPPRSVFLVHGEPKSSSALAGTIRRRLRWEVRVPRLGEIMPLAVF